MFPHSFRRSLALEKETKIFFVPFKEEILTDFMEVNLKIPRKFYIF